MVLPDKLLRVGLGLGMHLPSSGHGIAQRDVMLGGANSAAASTTDLVRFHSTLKVARGIVEEQKRAEMVEVSTDGLVSILDRIKALEEEVLALMNGNKKALTAGGEPTSASDPTGVGAGDEPAAGVATGVAAGGTAGGASTGSAQGSGVSGSAQGAAAGVNGAASVAPTASEETAPTAASNGAIFSEQDEEDDCAPEHLLYSLGGGALEKRGNAVSGHPLFRRNANCTLDSVAGSSKKASPAVSGSRPDVTPIASAAAESQDTLSADTKDSDAAPAANTPAGTSENAGGSDPAATAVNLDGKELPVTPVKPAELSKAADKPPAPVQNGNAADGSNAPKDMATPPAVGGSPPLSVGGVFKEEEFTTVVVTSTKDRTTTMTMTLTKTRTIHLKAAPSNSANAKYVEASSLPASAPAEASSASVATAPATESTEASDNVDASEETVPDDGAEASEASDSAVETTPAPTEGTAATPEASAASKQPMPVGQERIFTNNTRNDTIKQFPPVNEHITIPSTLLENPTPFASRPAVTPAPMSKGANRMFNAFVNGTGLDTRSSGFRTIPTMREEVPVTEAQQ